MGKILVWTFMTTMLILSLTNLGFSFQNEPDGFRGLKWGDPPTEDMILLGTLEGERKGYELPNEKLYLGDAHFYSIIYSFYDQPERFMIVHLYFNGEKNYDLLKTICLGRFGEETEEGFYEHFWLSQKASVRLHYDLSEEKGGLGLASFVIFNEFLKAQEKRQIEKAEEDW